MPSPETHPADAYQAAARDCAALATLLHRHLNAHAALYRSAPNWAAVGDLQRLRHHLYDLLIPTRECQDETEARHEIDALVAKIRPARV